MARWVRSEGQRLAYTDLDQQVSVEDLRAWDEEMYFSSCWLMSIRCPVLPYHMFLDHCEYLERHWDSLSTRLKRLTSNTRLSAAAPTVATILTREDKMRAICWKIRALQGFNDDSVASGDLQQAFPSPSVRALDTTDGGGSCRDASPAEA